MTFFKMAGGVEHHKLALDPALVKLGHMQSNRHIYFRWTPRTARISFIYIAVVPAIIGYIGYKSDVSLPFIPGQCDDKKYGQTLRRDVYANWCLLQGLFDLRAKRKGDLVYER
ncbi:nadh: ubiquinone oxidoreductase subunit [Colletotrichum karsti]|uniref:Nadh: ubiquinone oxidoreductase subunit n=1 Tax=Colletotrichum karsti TaxID=1095194 RepID=A0A9P6HWE4_9PEZI|nr:nadh: ubiquinone oxidoreductase subunit [Colletotrichum karsti]KAF9872708.1 nadh: ubiquinone oxidoreductase subunit [Colletotrichum karsti]